MKSKITAFALIMVLCLSGCTKENDFMSQISEKNNPGMAVYTKLPDENTSYDVVQIGADVFYGVYDALNKTSLSEYVLMNENSYEIDMQMYIMDYIEKNQRESIELETEDRRKMILGDEEFWTEYHWVVEDDILYLENSAGQIISDFAFIFFSKNEEIKEQLISDGYESVCKIYENIDEKIMAELDDNIIPSYHGQLYNCEISYSLHVNSISMTGVEIPAKAMYLADYHQNDNWAIVYGGVNQSCESITMLYTVNEFFDYTEGEFEQFNLRADIIGTQGKIKELKLTYDKNTDTIPQLCRPTLIECMKQLGCSDGEITAFLEEIPKESGNIDKLFYTVTKIDKTNYSIKLYLK